MISPLDYLQAIREKYPDKEPHHCLTVGMGRNRKKQLAEHYTAVPLTREEHDAFHAGDHATQIRVMRDCIRQMAAMLHREWTYSADVEGHGV